MRVLNLLLLAGFLFGSAAVWFGGSGTPGRAMTGWDWFSLPVLAVAIAGLMEGVVGFAMRRPHLLNVPEKDVVRAMPPAQQARVFRPIRQMLFGCAALTTLMLVFVQVARYREIVGRPAEVLTWVALGIGIVGLEGWTLVGLVRFFRTLGREVRTLRQG